MILSEQIAKLIDELLNESDGVLEIGRNELASRMGCVPSQINYVITSRFTPQRGYIVESRRGGGGYIKIMRVRMDRNQYLMHVYNAVNDSITFPEAKAFCLHLYQRDIITQREAELILSALSDKALEILGSSEDITIGRMRAEIFKSVILKLAAM